MSAGPRRAYVAGHVRWMWRFWRSHKGAIVLLFLLTVISTTAALSFPMVLRYIVDELHRIGESLAPADSKMPTLISLLLLVGLARSLRNLYPMFRARMNCVLEMEVRRHYFARVLGKGHRFFVRFRTGDVVTRLIDDVSGFPKVAWFLCSGVFRAVEAISWLVFCIGAMLYIDARLALVAIAPLPFMMLLFWRVRAALGVRFEANQRAISATAALVESCYSGIRIVKSANAEARMAERLAEGLSDRLEVEMKVVRLRAFLDGVYQAMGNVGQVAAITVGGLMALSGRVSPGDVWAIYLYVSQLVRPLMDVPQLFIFGKQAFVCMDRLTEIEEAEPPPAPPPADDVAPVPRVERIEIENVSFQYDPEIGAPALEGVSLTIPRGRRVALVGPIGSGKSTLARILSGELSPSDGRILVNGRPIREIDLSDYRRRIGYIPQEPLLFSDTIRENVAFGRAIDDREFDEALAIAQVEREVAGFPRGAEEMLGQRGVRVSGGQRQRLAIARAVVGAPDFLVMDDVTAALDAENEEALWDAIVARRPDVTAVIVTHRIATARRADEIVVMDAGRVVARGSHATLVTHSPLYRRLALRHDISDKSDN